MRIGNSVLSWLVMVISGSIIVALIYRIPAAVFYAVLISGLFSLPYLVFYAALANLIKKMWYIQVLHFALFALTLLVMYIFGIFIINRFFSIESLTPLVYYFVGAISHALFFYKDPMDGNAGPREDVLDDML